MPELNFAEEERKILDYWDEHKVFKKSVDERPAERAYVFYDGPPFATGLPHYGSLLTSIIKDVIPRYWTMKGYRVARRWGWDCHGLPIENIIEKKLGINSRKEIEEIGIDKFCGECRNAIFKYDQEWERIIRRLARWVDFKHSYKTMDNSYMESVWWAFKTLHDKGLVYKGTRTALYCPRCETPLSNFEIAMDNSYHDVEDTSVYVKFRAGIRDVEGKKVPRYFLAWTTTPWTLPANKALAVHPKEYYVEIYVPSRGEVLVLGKKMLFKFFPHDGEIEYSIVQDDLNGDDFAGESFEPLYPHAATGDNEKDFKVYAADFVTMEDGTGIVHIAPAFGEVDHQLGSREGLTIETTVDSAGQFNELVPDWQGRNVWEANEDVVAWLEKNGVLFKEEKIFHSYPFCWRCDTKLLFYTQNAWFINVEKIKKDMLVQNEFINWYPGYLKHGRFGKGLETAPDWCVSRSRYWGSPLPVWECDNCDKRDIVGSIDELMQKPNEHKITKVTFVRHGETEWNVAKRTMGHTDIPLNETGKQQARDRAVTLEPDHYVVLYASDLTRCKETAAIFNEKLNLPVHFDERLREKHWGDFQGQTDEFRKKFWKVDPSYNEGETLEEVEKRLRNFLAEIIEKHKGESIIAVTHGGVKRVVKSMAEGEPYESMIQRGYKSGNAEATVYYFFVEDDKVRVLDLHRPIIDKITFQCSCGGTMRRIPEVFDCWIESGSMPYASVHYPFENKEWFENNFPAQFITEYISQTRAWFYVVHVLSTALFGKPAFTNALVHGIVQAEDGKKMSKHLNNYPDPEMLFERYSVDALRYYLMSSSVMSGENLNFSEREVEDVYKKVNILLWNVFTFWKTYAHAADKDSTLEETMPSRGHILDRWILARLEELIKQVTQNMDNYDLVRATRPLGEFIADFSQWYVRRSRERMKAVHTAASGTPEFVEARAATNTLRYVLGRLSQVIAPVMPFLAERLYKGVGGSAVSVHLIDWPDKRGEYEDIHLLQHMGAARKVIEMGLAVRSEAGIKVRQPLEKFEIKRIDMPQELLSIIAEELNVKQISMSEHFSAGQGWVSKEDGVFGVNIFTELTPALQLEGMLREVVRGINHMRRDAGLVITDAIVIYYEATGEAQKIFTDKAEDLKVSVTAVKLVAGKKEGLVSSDIKIDGGVVWVGIEKK